MSLDQHGKKRRSNLDRSFFSRRSAFHFLVELSKIAKPKLTGVILPGMNLKEVISLGIACMVNIIGGSSIRGKTV